MRLLLSAIALLFLLLPGAGHAQKVALVLANSDYEFAGPLANPANDGRIVAQSIRDIGFDTVVEATDADLDGFQTALRNFRDAADGADAAMVYYAGHGIEAQGRNWLLPTDAQLGSHLDLPYEAIDLDRVMEALSGAQVRIVALDACRNNPFARGWNSATRSVSRGLAGIEVDDVLVIYAAAPGQTASDGTADNSPFALALAKRLTQPGLPIQLLGGMVRDDVLTATDGIQRPFISASITGTPVYLTGEAPGTMPVLPGAPAPTPAEDSSDDRLAWESALQLDTIEAYRAYLDAFADGRFAGLAGANVTRLLDPTSAGAKFNDRSSARSLISFDAALPYRYQVKPGDPLAIDGLWTVTTIDKRVRIEQGRIFAVDAWNNALFFRVKTEMVTMRDVHRTGPGTYVGQDLVVPGRTVMTLRGDGNIDAVVAGPLGPAKFGLVREAVDDPQAFEAEQARLRKTNSDN